MRCARRSSRAVPASWALHIIEGSTLVNDQQVGLQIFVQRAVGLREGLVFEEVADDIEDRAVQDREADADHLVADGLHQMTFSGAWRADQKTVRMLADKVAGGHVVEL